MKPSDRKTVNLALELRSGRHYGVFIDDADSPGQITSGLHAQQKSWAAVVVPPHQTTEVLDQLPRALTFLRELGLRKTEFHFADIWGGVGDFRNMDLQQRLGIFRFMAHLFEMYRFSVLVQTFDPDNAIDNEIGTGLPVNVGPLKTYDHGDLALILVLLRVRIHLKSLDAGNTTACVVVDEGRLSSGNSIVLPGLAPIFVAGAVHFANSRLVHPIQLADFAAFIMNRWQLLRVKQNLSELDKTFLDIVSPIGEQSINLDSVPVQNWQSSTEL